MLTLRVGSHRDWAELRRLRHDIFVGELGIQSPTYQDVFNDAFSKNFVLEAEDRIAGSIRVVFSSITGNYCLSYFMIASEFRALYSARQLIGGVLLLMRVNRIEVLFADAHDGVLGLYERFGCRKSAARYVKYGFSCAWTPMCYRLGHNRRLEDSLVASVESRLRHQDLRWRFTCQVAMCESWSDYIASVGELLANHRVSSVLPVLICPDHRHLLARLAGACPHVQVTTTRVQGVRSDETRVLAEYDQVNAWFSGQQIVVAERGSGLEWPGRLYCLLVGGTLVVVERLADAWSLPRTARPPLLLGLTGSRFAVPSVTDRPGAAVWEVAMGDTPEQMSWLLVERYLSRLGPPLSMAASGTENMVENVCL